MKLAKLLIFLMTVSCLSYADEKCMSVTGELNLWNGWPPNVRIKSESGVHYGVSGEGDNLPSEILEKFHKDIFKVKGKFCLVLLGEQVTVPYQSEPINLVEILRFQEN